MKFNNIKDITGKKYSFSLENNVVKFGKPNNEPSTFNEDIFISSGWIDIHTHCNPLNNFVGSNPDQVGYQTGVCLVIDAGSCGLDNIDELFVNQHKYKTNIKALLNISKIGIPGQHELNNLDDVQVNYDQDKYQDFIIGYKARVSGSVVGNNGVESLVKFNQQRLNDLPLMVHIGNEPPSFDKIVDLMQSNDILTHVYNGKNEAQFKNGKPSAGLKKAVAKNIKFDVGHGTSSFDGQLFKQVLQTSPKFKPDFISTDIYSGNIESGVVQDLPTTMSKMRALGMEWSDVIDAVTVNVGNHFNLKNYGTINNNTNNFTFFKIIQGEFKEVDSKGQEIILTEKIVPVAVIVNGEYISLEEENNMNLYKELNLKKVINADGRMTILGVSTISDTVGEQMKLAGQSYFVMKDLETSVDQQVAAMYGFEAAHIVNSASAGISLGIMALIYGDRVHDVNLQVPEKNEVVLLKGHNVNFGAPVEDLLTLVGGKVVEAGYANLCTSDDVEYRINQNTACLVYVVSHHTVQKGMLSLEAMIKIAQKHNLPLLVDSASESDLAKYAHNNIDLVVFSGAKALEGPTSGVVFGKQTVINNIIKHHKNTGRTMKVGKENIVGLYTALKNYSDLKKTNLNKANLVDDYYQVIKDNKYVQATINPDSLRPEIQRIKITLNKNAKLNATQLSEQLKNGEIAIYLRDYFANQNWLEIDLRSINLAEMELINQRVNELLGG